MVASPRTAAGAQIGRRVSTTQRIRRARPASCQARGVSRWATDAGGVGRGEGGTGARPAGKGRRTTPWRASITARCMPITSDGTAARVTTLSTSAAPPWYDATKRATRSPCGGGGALGTCEDTMILQSTGGSPMRATTCQRSQRDAPSRSSGPTHLDVRFPLNMDRITAEGNAFSTSTYSHPARSPRRSNAGMASGGPE